MTSSSSTDALYVGRVLFVVEHSLVFLEDKYSIRKYTRQRHITTYIHWTLKNDTRVLKINGSNTNKIVTFQPGGSTHGNCRVPLNESQFLETQPKARKAYGNLARLKNGKPNPT